MPRRRHNSDDDDDIDARPRGRGRRPRERSSSPRDRRSPRRDEEEDELDLPRRDRRSAARPRAGGRDGRGSPGEDDLDRSPARPRRRPGRDGDAGRDGDDGDGDRRVRWSRDDDARADRRSPRDRPPRRSPRDPRHDPDAPVDDRRSDRGHGRRDDAGASDDDRDAAERARHDRPSLLEQTRANTAASRSANRAVARYHIQGPLRRQPKERPRDAPYTCSRITALCTVVVLGVFTLASFEIVCLMHDVCFRTDPAVVQVGSIGALPVAAAVLFLLIPLGFYASYYERPAGLTCYLVLAVLVALGLLAAASVSWAGTTDTVAQEHVDATWTTLSIDDRSYFGNDKAKMMTSYQDSGFMFGIVAFVGFILVVISVLAVLIQCVVVTSADCCDSRGTVLG